MAENPTEPTVKKKTKGPSSNLNELRSIVNAKNLPEEDIFLKVASKLQLHEVKEVTSTIKRNTTILDVQKYDIIYTTIGVPHYAVVVEIDREFGTIWVISITSDCTMSLAIKIKESRLFASSYYVCYLAPIFNKNEIKYCGIADNKKEVDLIYKSIKNYYKQNFK